MLSTAAGAGVGFLMFVVSIVVAGLLLANAAGGSQVARAFATRLAAERGEKLVELAGATVRSVARGILGVALIQSLLAGLGCLAVGMADAFLKPPFDGPWRRCSHDCHLHWRNRRLHDFGHHRPFRWRDYSRPRLQNFPGMA